MNFDDPAEVAAGRAAYAAEVGRLVLEGRLPAGARVAAEMRSPVLDRDALWWEGDVVRGLAALRAAYTAATEAATGLLREAEDDPAVGLHPQALALRVIDQALSSYSDQLAELKRIVPLGLVPLSDFDQASEFHQQRYETWCHGLELLGRTYFRHTFGDEA